jgi:nitroreductase
VRLNLSADELLTTTRSVRKRLDLDRPVEREVLVECLEIATQAPTGSNAQGWHWVIVTDQQKKDALGEIYRKAWAPYVEMGQAQMDSIEDPGQRRTQERVVDSAGYLAENLHRVPVLVIPCLWGRYDGMPGFATASMWGSLFPAAWSFMLAARERGLGTCWTSLHLMFEQEAAEVLGIPYEKVSQGLLIPVAYTKGTDFKPGPRRDLDAIAHWDAW